VEYLDAELHPEHPFVDSNDNLDIGEYFKYALSTASYILACEDVNQCLNFLRSRDGGLDLLGNTTLETTLNMEGTVYGEAKAFMLRFEGDPRPFKFTVDDCGGCPAFLSFWEEICREVDDTQDPWNVPLSKYTDQQSSVRECLEHLLKSVFVIEKNSDEAARLVRNEILEIRPIVDVAKD
jgi:hypothetical protein